MLLIKNGLIYTMNSDFDIIPGSIFVHDKNIVKIGTNEEVQEYIREKNYKDIEEIDATNCWVLPGLIEAHCHIGITEEKTGLKGDDCNEVVNPITPYLKAIDGINPMDAAFHDAVKAGITSVHVGPGSANIVGGQWVFMKTTGRDVDQLVVLEPSAMKIAFGENPKTNYSGLDVSPVTRMAIGGGLREELTKAKEYLQKKARKKKAKEDFDIDFRYECWEPVFNHEIPLKAHVHRADDILTAIRIAKEFGLDMTLDHCSEGHLIAPYIKSAGFPAIIGPSLSARSKVECQNASFKTSGILAKEGILVSITTDHPVTLIQYLPICAGYAAKYGLGINEALKAITINAAKICRVDQRVGSIELGKDGDFAIFDGNPMEVFTKVMFTIIDGVVVYDHRKDELDDIRTSTKE